MIKAAVVGVGAMGQHHARNYSKIKGVKLVGISDLDRNTGEEIAKTYNTKFYQSYIKLISSEKPDLVSIAVPTSSHKQVSLNIINKGIAILVEKH